MQKRFLFLPLIILLLATGAVHTWIAIGPKVDALWLHYIGYRWFEPERAISVERANRLDDAYGAIEMARREVVFRNYPIAAVTQYAFRDVGNLPIAIGTGLYLHYLIGIGLFLLAANRLRNMIPLGLMLSAVALTALLPGPKPTDHLLLYSGFNAIANLIAVLIAPGESFNPMSPWPKNVVLLLALAMVSLRCEGRYREAYALCLTMMLFHVSLGLVILALTIAIDIARRVFPVLKTKEADTLLLVGGCAVGGVIGLAIYIISDPAMPWDVPSAFVQLATRLFVLATLVTFLWIAEKATAWLQARLSSDTQIFAIAMVSGVAFLMCYAAAGSLWERSRSISVEYTKIADSSLPDDIEKVYLNILVDLHTSPP